ncbi:MAG: ABC transporter ATP-binding protein [Candidatus Algichlamydia australiensis]|nr:ABC transporter ATP-binding protein [Chlamydiales bacterium]
MRSINLKNVTKSYGNSGKILSKIHLTIPSGKFFALLGPSGCGKTTLLRLIGGFEEVDSGTITIGEKEITHLPINKRRIHIVFQNYALFPHLNVFDNIAYSLVIQGLSKDEIQKRVMRIVRAFHLEKQVEKLPSELSGGQQQRVAIGRAIINEPDVLLLDEPLAALDYKLREKMLVELIELQDKLKTTFVYVTHDQFEALTVADQMAIMNSDGEIEQIGTPKEIYEFPVSSFVAKFVGTTNILNGVMRNIELDPEVEVEGLGSLKVYVPQKKPWMANGGSVVMSLRPEKIFISKKPAKDFSNQVEGSVQSIVYYGRSTQYNVKLGSGTMLQVFEQNEEHFPHEDIDYDDKVYLYWQRENVVLLEH